MKYKVGDKVMHEEYGKGIIVTVENDGVPYGCQFEKETGYGHTCHHTPGAKTGFCKWCDESEITLIKEVKSMYIDKEFLRKHDACTAGTRAFMEAYPNGGESADIIDRCKREGHDDWAEWLGETIKAEKLKKFKVGDKVVPVSSHHGSTKNEWRRAKKNNQPYLYVIRIDPTVYSCSADKTSLSGDWYGEEDLVLYNETTHTTETSKSIHAYDLMKLAAENPQKYEGKKYRVTAGELHLRSGDLATDEVIIIRDGMPLADGTKTCFITPNTELEEIIEDKEVSFMEAVKAYSEGRVVTVKTFETGVTTEHYFNPYGVGNRYLKDGHGSNPTINETVNGVWFVKAGE